MKLLSLYLCLKLKIKIRVAVKNQCKMDGDSQLMLGCPTDFKKSTGDQLEVAQAGIESATQCPVCRVRLKSEKNLARHLRKVHSENSFQCDVCPLVYTEKTSLIEHKVRDHVSKSNCEYCLSKTNQRRVYWPLKMHPVMLCSQCASIFFL